MNKIVVNGYTFKESPDTVRLDFEGAQRELIDQGLCLIPLTSKVGWTVIRLGPPPECKYEFVGVTRINWFRAVEAVLGVPVIPAGWSS